jgi:RHS repeat-associated protein
VKRLIILVLAALALSLPLAAQNIDTSMEFFRGLNSYNAFDFGSFDSVNEDNDNLTVGIPIISYPQRGALPDFQLKLHYAGWSWYMTCVIVNNIQQCNWYPGQSGAFLTIDPHYGGGNRTCSKANCGSPCPCYDPYVVDWNGGIHNEGLLSSSGPHETIDGSGIRASSTDRNGITASYFSITDPAGNTITHNYANTPPTWTDSVGRTIPDSDLPTNPQGLLLAGCTTKNFPRVNGGTAPLMICASNVTYSSQFATDPYHAVNYSGTKAMITSITLPNNTTWTFSYNSWGDLSQITTPTGGSVSYAWYNHPLYYTNSPESNFRGIATRTANANDGTGNKVWTYSATLNGTTYPGVTDPDGNMTVLSNLYCGAVASDGCVYTRRQFYTSSGVLLKTMDTQYTSIEDPLDVWAGLAHNQYILPTGTTTTWPNGFVSRTAITYDPGGIFVDKYSNNAPYPFPYGSVVQKQEYGYGSGAPGPLLRQTNTQFQWQNNSNYLSANLISQPASVTILNGSGTQVATTSYSYDSYNGSPQGVFGNLTAVTRWLNGGTNPTTQFVYNSNGMRTKMCDPIDPNCANPTRYTYDSTGAFLSQVQYPDTVTNGVTYHHIENFSYDSNTGLLNSHKDQNLQQTSYQYDSMRRLTRVDFPPADGGWETYSYNDSLPSPSFTFTKGAAPNPNFTETGIVDGFGRPKQTKTAVPTTTCSSGYSYVDTAYDNEGRKFSVSNPYCTTGDATYGLTKNYYDVLNRPCLVVPPDGTTPSGNSCPTTPPANDIFTTYSGNTMTVTDQAGKSRKSQTDGLGRMTDVWEDPNNLNYHTSYSYDALDNLLSVTQSGSRQRTFAYDSLSRLISSVNPESNTQPVSPFTIVPTTYSYDANGNTRTKTSPAPNQTGTATVTTTYTYDPLNRLLNKTYSDGTATVAPAYDINNPFGLSATNSIGRMVGLWEGDNQWLSWKAFSYDSMGRVVKQWDCLALANPNCNPMPAATVTYDLAGSMTSLIYPSGRKVTYAYNNAMQPTQVRFDSFNGTAVGYNYLSNATYAPTGAPASLTLGNGVIESASYNNRFQPCNFQAATGTFIWLNRTNNYYPTAGTNCQPGSGGNNGNVISITDNLQPNRTQSFGYDALNRVNAAQTQGTSGPDCWAQSFGYDAWANLLTATPTRSGCPMTQLSIGVNANNQITGLSYDAAGDMLADGVSTNAYDGESRIKTLNGSGATYIYSGDGQRVSKHIGSNTTDYVNFSGQPIGERNSSGDWSDYIYAGSRRLARADSFEYRIHTYGTVCGNCGWQAATFTFPNFAGLGGYVIQSGDTLQWRQYQTSGAHGGIAIWFTDSSLAQWVTYDQDSQQINSDGYQAVWHYRRVDLSQHAGKTLSSWSLVTESTTAAGGWEIFYQDLVLVSRDGTVRPIYNREQTLSLTAWWSSGVSGVGYDVNPWRWNGTNGAVSYDTTTNYYHGDHLGSQRLMTSVNGYPVWSSTFLPFGQEWNPQITVNHYKFTGKERDSESGLDNFGARYNSSQYGRFMTPDWSAKPMGVPYADMTDPQSLNLYSYVRNNPLNQIDPTGHYEVNGSNCGDDSKCQKRYDKVVNRFEKARAKDLKSKDANVRAAAASFGARGEKNGVHVGFGDLLSQGIKGSVDASNHGMGLTVDIQVRVDSSLGGKSLQETIAHEGTHVADDSNFLTSYDFVTGKYNSATNPTSGETEFRAFQAGAGVDREHGFGPHDTYKILDFLQNDKHYGPLRDVLIFDPNDPNYPQ